MLVYFLMQFRLPKEPFYGKMDMPISDTDIREVTIMGKVLKDWDGRHYERFSGHQKAWGHSLINELDPAKVEYEQLLKDTPFMQIEVWTEQKIRVFETEEELIGFIDNPGLIPFMKVLDTDALREEFRTEVINAMLQRAKDTDGSYKEIFNRMNVSAVK